MATRMAAVLAVGVAVVVTITTAAKTAEWA